MRRRDAFERDPEAFAQALGGRGEEAARARSSRARERSRDVATPDAALERAARLCMALGTDGLRGELTLIRAARALAALEGDAAVGDAHLRRVAPMALSHRLRRNPLDDPAPPRGSSARSRKRSARERSEAIATPWRRASLAATLFALDPLGLWRLVVRAAPGRCATR